MRIHEAIKLIKKTKKTISSRKASMSMQNRSSLFYWLIESNSSMEDKQKTLASILETNDWKVDEE